MQSPHNFVHATTCPLCDQEGICIFSRTMEDHGLRDVLVRRSGGDVDPSYYDGVKYELYRCPQCDHYYQTYMPDVAGLQSHSSHTSEESIELRTHINLGKRNIREIELIAPLIGRKLTDISVLEFGTGWGFWLRMADAYGYRTTGVEILPDRAERLRSQGLTVLPTLDQVEGNFDFIYSDQVMEHQNRPMPVLKQLVRLLKPDGIIHLMVPNGDIARKDFLRTDSLVKAIFPFEHVHCFTHQSLLKMAERAGLEPLPWHFIAQRLLGNITLSKNLHYFQEAVKMIRRQHLATNIYFRKRK
jgi:cyclopropane fatty-acyl-phospholipid synthase-like methyltransferase